VPERGDHPVNCVTFRQATAYCEWQDKRLPTSKEWERAARGDTLQAFPWGSEPATCERAVLALRGKRPGCDRSSTWPVGSKPAGRSVFGALDMSGNVWEWTVDPGGRLPILRGGAWNVDAREATVTYVYPYAPNKGTSSTGFRCARSLP
jgi:formylglycine-generating enzyme required for sulfatase activity